MRVEGTARRRWRWLGRMTGEARQESRRRRQVRRTQEWLISESIGLDAGAWRSGGPGVREPGGGEGEQRGPGRWKSKMGKGGEGYVPRDPPSWIVVWSGAPPGILLHRQITQTPPSVPVTFASCPWAAAGCSLSLSLFVSDAIQKASWWPQMNNESLTCLDLLFSRNT